MAYIKQEDILNGTNGGLDIILSYYPQAQGSVDRQGRKFKVRGDEKTASVSLKRNAEGIWFVTDFGGDQKPRNAIGICMLEDNKPFKDALEYLAATFKIVSEEAARKFMKAEVEFRDATPEEVHGHYDFETEDFDEHNLREIFADKVFSLFYNPGKSIDNLDGLRRICNRYHISALQSFTQIKDRKAIITKSSPSYPLFLIDEGEFKKIYQPRNPDKQYRFRYVGTKSKNHIYGLKEVEAAVKKLEAEASEKKADDPDAKTTTKLPEIILCSGDRDSLNVAALGYYPIWMNSETVILSDTQYGSIMQKCKELYYLGDIDSTGLKQMHEVCLTYLDIKAIRLPDELREKRDFRDNPCKDVRDYLKYYSKKKFIQLVNNAMPYRFWDEKPKFNRQGEYTGTEYVFNNAYAYNFLMNSGFYRYKLEGEKEGYSYIHTSGNIVKKLDTTVEVKDYLNAFIESRQMPIDLRNMVYKTPHLSETSLSNLKYVDLDFNRAHHDHQYFFFKNKTWKITKDNIEEFRPGEVKKHIWHDKVYNCNIKKLDPSFKVTIDDMGSYRVNILDNSCYFLKFLVNTSRVHWKVEEEGIPVKNAAGEVIGSRNELTDDEIAEHQQHLANKLYILGYLLHKHKFLYKSWCVFAMDNKISDSGESHGGSGKTAFATALKHMLSYKPINGRNTELTSNKHCMEGTTKHTDLILIDECSPYFDFQYFFAFITGDLEVNPKNAKQYSLPFEEAPKFMMLSNFTLHNIDHSTARRLIYAVFSDYYHHNKDGEYKETRSIHDDLKIQLFKDFTDEDWIRFYNTMAQCIQIYLQHDRIDPPMNNVDKRNLLTEMTDPFKSWADVYFSEHSERLDKLLPKKDLFTAFMNDNKTMKWATQRFTRAIRAWCKYYGFRLNPEGYRNTQGRIIRKVNGESTEMIYVQTTEKINIDPVNENGEESKAELPF